MAATTTMNKIIDHGIKSGERTHHHDHPITPVNLRIIKAIVSAPKNPMPLLLLLVVVELDILIIRQGFAWPHVLLFHPLF
jgi:hypothetical protein